MTLQHVSLSQLTPSKANPRKRFGEEAIAGLAASIAADGLLQNLVVRPAGGKGKRYLIISGERRYRALKSLEAQGCLPDGFTVPVEIREGLSKDERLRLATVENLQRANLTPLEETAALTALVHKGTALDEVTAQTGLSPSTIKRRLALNTLCDEAGAALDGHAITLAQAEALSLADEETQRGIIDEIGRGWSACTPADIREHILDGRPSVAVALFPLERYSGTVTTDLFGDAETSYFDDDEQFFTLQREAVEVLAETHRQTAAWVEVSEHWRIPGWQYREAEDGEQGGVVVNLSPNGTVDVLENLIRCDMDGDTANDTAENPLAPARKQAYYAAPLRRYIAHHKSLAVQELILSSPRKAKEVAAVQAITAFEPHEGLRELAKATDPQAAYAVMEEQAALFARKLRLDVADDQPGWYAFTAVFTDKVVLYAGVKALSDHELDELHTLLTALSFGQADCSVLDCADSLFNRAAQDMEADMTNHWRPDRAFLSRRTRAQLAEIAKECGYAEGRSAIGSYKKGELVEGILQHIEQAHRAENPTAAQEKALSWLPGVMHFPAIDPHAEPEETADVEIWQEAA